MGTLSAKKSERPRAQGGLEPRSGKRRVVAFGPSAGRSLNTSRTGRAPLCKLAATGKGTAIRDGTAAQPLTGERGHAMARSFAPRMNSGADGARGSPPAVPCGVNAADEWETLIRQHRNGCEMIVKSSMLYSGKRAPANTQQSSTALAFRDHRQAGTDTGVAIWRATVHMQEGRVRHAGTSVSRGRCSPERKGVFHSLVENPSSATVAERLVITISLRWLQQTEEPVPVQPSIQHWRRHAHVQ